MTKSIITVKRENFLMGLKIDFEVENLGFLVLFFVMADQFTKDFNVKKTDLDFAETWHTSSLGEKKNRKKKFFVPKIGGIGWKKSCSDHAENWHIWSSGGMTKSIFTDKRENFLMGLKMDFEFSRSGKFSSDFFYKIF